MTGPARAPALVFLVLLFWPQVAAAQTPGQSPPETLPSVADRALLEAAQRDDPELADFALAKGAQLEVRDPEGNTPLIVAQNGHLKILSS